MISDQLRIKQGPLARVWLASHWERKISKSQFLQTDLDKTIHAITTTQQEEPITLRISGQLLLGVVRIYSRKTKYLLEDCNEALVKIKLAFKKGDVNMPAIYQTVATANTITLQDKLTEFDILLPDLPFNPNVSMVDHDPIMENLGEFTMTQDITLSDIQTGFDFLEAGRAAAPQREVEVGRRDIEPGLAGHEFDMDVLAEPLKDMSISDTHIGLAGEAVEFDFDLHDHIDYGAEPHPEVEFNLPTDIGAEASIDTLMQVGIVVEDESVFGMEGITVEPTVRRRKRLVVDRDTEIPAEDLRRYIEDVSPIINKTEAIVSEISRHIAVVDLTMPSGGTPGSELESFLDRMNKKRRTIVEAPHRPRFEEPVTAPTPAAGGFAAGEAAAFQFDDYGHYDVAGFTEEAQAQFGREEAEITDEYDMLMAQNIQPFITHTSKTLEALQGQFETHDTVKFGELAPSTTKKADAAKLFYDILLLSTKDKIKVKQDRPFGEIQISPVLAH